MLQLIAIRLVIRHRHRRTLGFTAKLVEVGRGLGVEVLDHIIVAGNAFVSFKQRALM